MFFLAKSKKMILFSFLILFLLQGCTNLKKMKFKNSESKTKIEKNKKTEKNKKIEKSTNGSFCFAEYGILLPPDMIKLRASYQSDYLQAETYTSDNKYRINSILSGADRIEKWLDFVEKNRLSIKDNNAVYVLKDIEPQLKTIVYYYDNNEVEEHVFGYFLFKDFPEHKLGIMLKEGTATRPINYYDKMFKETFEEMASQTKQRANLVEYHSWPHKIKEFCLDNSFTISIPPLSKNEIYNIQFSNNKNSRIQITIQGEKNSAEIEQLTNEKTAIIPQAELFNEKQTWQKYSEGINKKIQMNNTKNNLDDNFVDPILNDSNENKTPKKNTIFSKKETVSEFNPVIKIDHELLESARKIRENFPTIIMDENILVAGQNGVLLIEKNEYIQTVRNFSWESTQINSDSITPIIKINGNFDSADYDENMNEEQIEAEIIKIISSIKPRF